MAIYRGPGGAGDATGDATNASALALAAKDEAQASATSAASSATAAANSATAADTSADSASTSATNASGSASTASTAATNASNSASDASDSADAAASSASDASDSATTAADSATSASTSASAASTSATNAASSASSASTSASTATTKASEASTSATNAASSASAASTSETNAASSASAAATSETNAASSASSASTSASNASTSASTATTQATNAASSASSAATSETNAASSASAASTSASNASTSATNASNSASAAATSASEAAASAVTAATFDPALYLAKADNLSGLANTVTAANNIGINPYGNGFKNRIINGAMMIDQRNAGASVTGNSFAVDRFKADTNGATATLTGQQSTTVPTSGFKNSLSYTATTTDTSLGTTKYYAFTQKVEGLNCSDLNFGASSAATVTLSFWVRSSLTGTFCVALRNSGASRSYVSTYTINSANTWEQKYITVTGDQSGTWLTTNGVGIETIFTLASGTNFQTTANAWQAGEYLCTSAQTNFMGTSGATFYITGVQLEKGSTATSFDYRPYGTELALCQRYYYKESVPNTSIFGCSLYASSSTGSRATGRFPVTLRAAPTALEQTGTAGDYNVNIAGTSRVSSAVPLFNSATTNAWFVTLTVASGQTAGQAGVFGSLSNNCYLAWSAEL